MISSIVTPANPLLLNRWRALRRIRARVSAFWFGRWGMRTSLARERLSAVHRMFLNIQCGSPECFPAADPSLQEHTMSDPLGKTEMIAIYRTDAVPPTSHLNRRHLLGM